MYVYIYIHILYKCIVEYTDGTANIAKDSNRFHVCRNHLMKNAIKFNLISDHLLNLICGSRIIWFTWNYQISKGTEMFLSFNLWKDNEPQNVFSPENCPVSARPLRYRKALYCCKMFEWWSNQQNPDPFKLATGTSKSVCWRMTQINLPEVHICYLQDNRKMRGWLCRWYIIPMIHLLVQFFSRFLLLDIIDSGSM